jgi:hypothetical protein
MDVIGCLLSVIAFGSASAFAGIRSILSVYLRCPCAGRQFLSLLLQRKEPKKAAHTEPLDGCSRGVDGRMSANGV